MTTDATQVTQAARQAAAMWARKNGRPMQAANIARGSCDTAPIVQAFAKFEARTTATLTAQVEALTAERDALREALAEQVGECFDERCEMCLRHEALLASTSEGEGA